MEGEYRPIPMQKQGNGDEVILSPDQHSRIRGTISSLLDYVLQVIRYSPEVSTIPTRSTELHRIWDHELETFHPSLLGTTLRYQPEWGVIVWNDERHSFPEVIDVLTTSTECSIADATRHAHDIDYKGRKVVFKSVKTNKAGRVASAIARTGLAVTVSPMAHIFEEEQAASMLKWIRDKLLADRPLNKCAITNVIRGLVCEELLRPVDTGAHRISRIQFEYETQGSSSTTQSNDADNPDGMNSQALQSSKDASLDPDLSTGDMGLRCTTMGYPRETKVIEVQSSRKCRLDAFMESDGKLWKEMRILLQELYVKSVLMIPKYKHEYGMRLGLAYSSLTKRYSTLHEKENCALDMAVQCFTVSSIAEELVQKHNFLDTMVALLEHLLDPSRTDRKDETMFFPKPLDVNEENFYGEDCRRVFSHLQYLLETPGVREYLCRYPWEISSWIRLLCPLMGLLPTRRYTRMHIEYEETSWINVFSMMTVVLLTSQLFVESICSRTAVQGVRGVEDQTKMVIDLSLSKLREWEGHILSKEYHTREIEVSPGSRAAVVEFRVASGTLSFHYPILFFLARSVAGLLRLNAWSSSEDLRDSFYSVSGASKSSPHQELRHRRFLSHIFDVPLRTYVWVSQTRSGLWVRNGFAMQGQAYGYSRDVRTRELYQDSDIFLLQIAAVILGADQVLTMILDRFDLLEWAKDQAQSHPLFSEHQMQTTVRDMLMLIMILVSEGGLATGMSESDLIDREIIHVLAVSPCSYSQLISKIPHSLSTSGEFDNRLRVLAEFTPQTAAQDSGHYNLRKEFLKHANLYFYHLAANHISAVEETFAKAFSGSPPLPKVISSGPFHDLRGLIHSPVFVEICWATIESCGTGSSVTEASFDILFKLMMMSLEDFAHWEREANFDPTRTFVYHAISRKKKDCGDEVFLAMIASRIRNPGWRAQRQRLLDFVQKLKAYGDDSIASMLASMLAGSESNDYSKQEAIDADALAKQKKAEAMARQNRILAEMASQRSAFMEQYGSELSDDEGDNFDHQPSHNDDIYANKLKLDCIMSSSSLYQVQETQDVCMVCQGSLGQDGRAYGIPSYPQISRLPRYFDIHDVDALDLVFSPEIKPSLDNVLNTDKTTLPGICLVGCSHFMHDACFLELMGTGASARTASDAILCPLCSGVRTVLLPVSSNWFPYVGSEASTVRCWNVTSLRDISDRFSQVLRSLEGEEWHKRTHSVPESYASLDRSMGLKMYQMLTNLSSMPPLIKKLKKDPMPFTREAISMFLDATAFTACCFEMQVRCRANALPLGSVTEYMKKGFSLHCLHQLRHMALLAIGHFHYAHTEQSPEGVLMVRCMFRSLFDLEETNLRGIYVHLAFLLTALVGYNLTESSSISVEDVVKATYALFERQMWSSLFTILGKGGDNCLVTEHGMDSATPPDSFTGELRTASEALSTSFPSHVDMRVIYAFVKRSRVVFGRRVLLLVYAFAPDAFASLCYTYASQTGGSEVESEYVLLSGALNLWPSMEFLDIPVLSGTIEYPGVLSLAQLPYRIEDLFEQCASMRCPGCYTLPRSPAICLVCGKLLCARSFCSGREDDGGGEAECYAHRRSCSGDTGIFLFVNEFEVAIISRAIEAHIKPPYLDSHGEVDVGLRRGRPHFLSAERMRELNALWINHGACNMMALRGARIGPERLFRGF